MGRISERQVEVVDEDDHGALVGRESGAAALQLVVESRSTPATAGS